MKLFLTLVIAMLVMAATRVSAAEAPAPGPSSDATSLSTAFASLFALAFALLFWFSNNCYMCGVEVLVFAVFFSFPNSSSGWLVNTLLWLSFFLFLGCIGDLEWGRREDHTHLDSFCCFFIFILLLFSSHSYSYVTNSLFLIVLFMSLWQCNLIVICLVPLLWLFVQTLNYFFLWAIMICVIILFNSMSCWLLNGPYLWRDTLLIQ